MSAAALDAAWVRAGADVQLPQQPRYVDQPGDADHCVDDVGEGSGTEDLAEDIRVAPGDSEDAPVEGTDDHQEQEQRVQSLQHFHRSPPANEECDTCN